MVMLPRHQACERAPGTRLTWLCRFCRWLRLHSDPSKIKRRLRFNNFKSKETIKTTYNYNDTDVILLTGAGSDSFTRVHTARAAAIACIPIY